MTANVSIVRCLLTPHHRPAKFGAGQISIAEIAAFQLTTGEIRAAQILSAKTSAVQILSCEIFIHVKLLGLNA